MAKKRRRKSKLTPRGQPVIEFRGDPFSPVVTWMRPGNKNRRRKNLGR